MRRSWKSNLAAIGLVQSLEGFVCSQNEKITLKSRLSSLTIDAVSLRCLPRTDLLMHVLNIMRDPYVLVKIDLTDRVSELEQASPSNAA